MSFHYRKKLTLRTKPNRISLWQFFNSPLFLFLGSSVIISGVGSLWQYRSSVISRNETKAQLIEKLQDEIKFRILLIDPMLGEEFSYTAMYTATGALEGITGNRDTDGDVIGYYSPIHDEFQGRSLASLLWNLSSELTKFGKPNRIYRLTVSAMKVRSAVDEGVVLKKAVRPGLSSSIWAFSRPEIRASVTQRVEMIRTEIAHLN